MRYAIPVLLASLLLVPAAHAQNRFFDLTGNVVWVDPTGGGSFKDLADPTDIDFEGKMGYGAAANVFFGERVSAEFAVSRVNLEASTRRRAVTASGGDLEMMPITAVLQYHFAPQGFIDPYIGGGAAYVLFDDISANGVNGVDRINFKDDVGFAVNAGLGIRLGQRLGLTLDGKYVPIETNAKAVIAGGPETEARVDISPIILSAGLSLRF